MTPNERIAFDAEHIVNLDQRITALEAENARLVEERETFHARIGRKVAECVLLTTDLAEARGEVRRLTLHLEHRSGGHHSPEQIPGCPGCFDADAGGGEG